MGPLPWPRSVAVLIPASTYLHAAFTAFGTGRPLLRFDAIAARMSLDQPIALIAAKMATHKLENTQYHECFSNVDRQNQYVASCRGHKGY